jgi:hypothetical protein
MFDPDVEARFQRIEDELLVTAELQRRFEMEGKERIGRLEAFQDAMARSRQEVDGKMSALIDIVAHLSETVERFLKSRSNGGAN